MFQTKGGNSEHLEMLKRKGISACARIANQMPLNKMSLLSLERLFRAVVIPSCTYGLSAISNQLCEDNYDLQDVVQGRLVKLWFGVSKFASTSSLVNAVDRQTDRQTGNFIKIVQSMMFCNYNVTQ